MADFNDTEISTDGCNKANLIRRCFFKLCSKTSRFPAPLFNFRVTCFTVFLSFPIFIPFLKHCFAKQTLSFPWLISFLPSITRVGLSLCHSVSFLSQDILQACHKSVYRSVSRSLLCVTMNHQVIMFCHCYQPSSES